jgi:hypothetical protein
VEEVSNITEAYSWSITKIAQAFQLNRMTVRKRLVENGVNPVIIKGNSKLYSLADVGPALFGVVQTIGECGG